MIQELRWGRGLPPTHARMVDSPLSLLLLDNHPAAECIEALLELVTFAEDGSISPISFGGIRYLGAEERVVEKQCAATTTATFVSELYHRSMAAMGGGGGAGAGGDPFGSSDLMGGVGGMSDGMGGGAIDDP